jgi:hypothetical protein
MTRRHLLVVNTHQHASLYLQTCSRQPFLGLILDKQVKYLQGPKHPAYDVSFQECSQVRRGQAQWEDAQGDQIVCC